ncbi:hypothetical protein C8Q74DRAFT_566973 [Fomes fomentarius]|nr:hypothetical protein C8Q74DRAFT_566973 [Fomes fomentarius]
MKRLLIIPCPPAPGVRGSRILRLNLTVMDRGTNRPTSDDSVSLPGPSTIIASAPFNRPHADTILRTSDNVDFHVWKGILIEASPVFADMFALGARGENKPVLVLESPTNDIPSAGGEEHTIVIHILERSDVLDLLLRMCYPPPRATFPTLDVLNPVLAAAHKYQMDEVLEVLKIELLTHAPTSPLRVYIIAQHYDMTDTAQAALRHSLAHPADEYAPELKGYCAASYHRLLAYRKQCTQTLSHMFASNLAWLPDNGWHFLTCSCARESVICKLRDSNTQHYPKTWFWQHHQRLQTLLLERPGCAAIEDSQLRERVVKDASACPNCRTIVHDSMRSFTTLLYQEIDRRIAEIPLPLQ